MMLELEASNKIHIQKKLDLIEQEKQHEAQIIAHQQRKIEMELAAQRQL